MQLIDILERADKNVSMGISFLWRWGAGLTPVQKIYGDAAQRNFEIEKKAYKGAPIGRTSGQISRTEPIPMVGNNISL